MGGLQLSYNVTALRRDQNYITYYVNWFLLLTTGILPMGALIFLNSRIYAKILETRRLRERCRIRSSTVIALQTRNATAATDSSVTTTAAAAAAGASEANAVDSKEDQPIVAVRNTKNVAPKRHEAMSPKDIKMARVLLSIVLVFFICHAPRYVCIVILIS